MKIKIVRVMTQSILVRRKIALSFIGSNEPISRSISLLADNPAISKVDYDSTDKSISIEYDQLLINYTDLLAILSKLDTSYKKGFGFKLRTNWYDYLDTTARENASAPPPACCNKPPKR